MYILSVSCLIEKLSLSKLPYHEDPVIGEIQLHKVNYNEHVELRFTYTKCLKCVKSVVRFPRRYEKCSTNLQKKFV